MSQWKEGAPDPISVSMVAEIVDTQSRIVQLLYEMQQLNDYIVRELLSEDVEYEEMVDEGDAEA